MMQDGNRRMLCYMSFIVVDQIFNVKTNVGLLGDKVVWVGSGLGIGSRADLSILRSMGFIVVDQFATTKYKRRIYSGQKVVWVGSWLRVGVSKVVYFAVFNVFLIILEIRVGQTNFPHFCGLSYYVGISSQVLVEVANLFWWGSSHAHMRTKRCNYNITPHPKSDFFFEGGSAVAIAIMTNPTA